MGYEVDFLPVGEGERSGDAIAARFGDLHGPRESQVVIVIDGGFSDTGEQLARHIRTYYNTDRVDVVLSTHPDADHANGLTTVLEEMSVETLLMHQPWKHTTDMASLFKSGRVTDQSVREQLQKSLDAAYLLEEHAQRKGIRILEPFTGVSGWNGAFRILGPSKTYYESLLPHFRGTPEPKHPLGIFEKALQGAMQIAREVAERWDYETLSDEGETTPENNTGAVLLLTFEGRSLLFTADVGMPALTQVADVLDAERFDYGNLKFIQVPHHGSRRNVGPTILNRFLGPRRAVDEKLRTAFVSCAKDGEPKHPSKKVANAFRRRAAPVHATQGSAKRHHYDAPDREGWSASVPLPFYRQVEESGE